jgi:hypothetical protein
MKIVPVRFQYQKTSIFGWLVMLCIIGYIVFNIVAASYFK